MAATPVVLRRLQQGKGRCNGAEAIVLTSAVLAVLEVAAHAVLLRRFERAEHEAAQAPP